VAESVVEQLGLLGVFIAGAVPWLEAVVVIPIGILLGLPVVWTVVLALAGNIATIVLFAAGSERILSAIARRREKHGKPDQDDSRTARAKRIFVRYGDVGMAVVGPLVIGTQFAAAIAVSLGVSVWRASVVQSLGAVAWGIAAAYTAYALFVS
jgi:Ca2+/H+ antiporter, TMEM165/GDT1 family